MSTLKVAVFITFLVCMHQIKIRISVQRWSTSWTAAVKRPAGATDFSLLRCVQTGCGTHITSI
jgi:hypothetical protein